MGWIVTTTLLLGVQRLAPNFWDPPGDPVPLCILDPEAPLPVRRISPRAWRGLPSVGPTRALALADALWCGGAVGPEGINLTEITGIGALTAERILKSSASGSILWPSDWLPRSPPGKRGTSGVHLWKGAPMSPSPENLPVDSLPAPRVGFPEDLDVDRMDEVIAVALAEDRGAGDITSEGLLSKETRARARLVARDPGVLAGLGVFARTFELCDPHVECTLGAQDGERVEPGQELAVCVGTATGLLLAERTALNLLQRMSGIATQTARFVEAARGQARILDTRKTTPGLRALEKYAVRCGGGENHRFGLFDEAMIKENHLALADCDLEQALERLRREVGTGVRITAEASDKEEACAAVRGGADVILLDNFSPEGLLELCPRLRQQALDLGRKVELEASGGI